LRWFYLTFKFLTIWQVNLIKLRLRIFGHWLLSDMFFICLPSIEIRLRGFFTLRSISFCSAEKKLFKSFLIHFNLTKLLGLSLICSQNLMFALRLFSIKYPPFSSNIWWVIYSFLYLWQHHTSLLCYMIKVVWIMAHTFNLRLTKLRLLFIGGKCLFETIKLYKS
jgi:hypothetical protein